MRKYISFFAAIAALSSCTITKRHYAPGYHLAWKNDYYSPKINVDKDLKMAESPFSDDNISPSLIANQSSNENVIEREVTQFTNTKKQVISIAPKSEKGNDIEYLETEDLKVILQTDTIEDPNVNNPSIVENNKLNQKALWGFILSVFGWPIVYGAIAGFLLSSIAIKEIKANGGRGMQLAKWGFYFPLVLAGFIVLWVIGYGLLYFTS